MAFNANFVRQQRLQKNATSRVAKPSNFANAPFVEVADLIDGIYNIRLWPADPQKNPHGYLHSRSHSLVDAKGGRTNFDCPRNTNYEPFPYAWEVYNEQGDLLRTTTEIPDEDEYPLSEPLYKERCWACELEAWIANKGVELKNLPENVQCWLLGSQKPYTEGLLGNEHWFFPCSVTAEVYSKEEIVREDGRKFWSIKYAPTPLAGLEPKLLHCVLKLRDSKIKDELLRLIEDVPDCSNMLMGRWFRLEKKNEGKGVGGYTLSCAPNPSNAGFELPANLYPNFSAWGKGNAKYNKPSKRIPFATIEALGSDPSGFWVKTFRDLGIPLSDSDPTDDGMPF